MIFGYVVYSESKTSLLVLVLSTATGVSSELLSPGLLSFFRNCYVSFGVGLLINPVKLRVYPLFSPLSRST